MTGPVAVLHTSRHHHVIQSCGSGGFLKRLPFAATQDLWVKPLQCLPELLVDLGADPRSVFRRAGVDLTLLADPENRLDFAQVGRLFQESVAATKCDHIGLLLGQRAGTEAAGLTHRLIPFTRTVRSALYAARAHLHLSDRGGVLVLTPLTDALMEVAYVVVRALTPGAGQIEDASVAILLQALRVLGAVPGDVVGVTLARDRPRDVGPYRLYYRAPLSFNAPRFAVIVRTELLDRRPPLADASAEAAIRKLISRAETARPRSLELKVRDLAAAMLPSFAPSFTDISSALSLSPRTLQRRLADEGTTVTEIVDGIKAELARRLLVDTRMPIHEIAQTLHYDKPGAFSRAFVGWAGTTPRAARQAVANRTRARARISGAG